MGFEISDLKSEITISSETVLPGFCPESPLFLQLGVNPHSCLCGVKHYASAQMLDILDPAKNDIFPNQKHTIWLTEFPDAN